MSTLYVVATPIGNLEDISSRAIGILNQVDLIAAEDTRHSKRLLEHYHILTPLISYHDHNESSMAVKLIARVKQGTRLALISDAGTPLISDPGFELTHLAHEENIPVVVVPGPSALIAALSVSGMSSNRFVFEGFLPSRSTARVQRLNELRVEPRTLLFYEAPHRIEALVQDLVTVFGREREVCIARELTKKHEQVCKGPAASLAEMIAQGAIPQRGELVVMVEGSKGGNSGDNLIEWEKLLRLLLTDLSPSRAAAIVSRVSGETRKSVYDYALKLNQSG